MVHGLKDKRWSVQPCCLEKVIQEYFFPDCSYFFFFFFLRKKCAMSRCFPFPPPGYERKHRPEDLDLLKEGKCKEKKPKKEKEDKGRKLDKEKEKDGSAEKHRHKKDQKGKKHKDKNEKYRDKKMDKEDRGKDKEKSSISEESTVAQNEEIIEGKLYLVGNSKGRSNVLNEGKCAALLQDQNGGKPLRSSLPSQRNVESKFVQDSGRRVRDEKCRGSQLPERVAVTDEKDREMSVRAAVKNSSGVLTEQKGDNKNKRVDKRMYPQSLKNEHGGNTMVQNLIPIVKSKGEEIPKPVNEENGWRLEDKEKYKETVGIKKKHRSTEKKKDDKAKLKAENEKSEEDKLKDDGRNNLGCFAGSKSNDMLKGAISNAVNEGNIKKRKDVGTNGFHEGEIRPNKMQRPAPHQSTENGRKLEHFRTPTKSSNDKHAVPNSVGVDNEDQLINGIFEAPKPSQSKPNNPPAATMPSGLVAEASKLPQRDSNDVKKAVTVSKMEDPIAEASRRYPHPDSKYLAELLTVPKNIADLYENDTQDWLFSENVAPSKLKLKSFGDMAEDVRVWSEAVHIVSAAICALPYVIPY